MRYAFTDRQLAWRDEVRAFIHSHMTPALAKEMRRLSNEEVGPEARKFQATLREKGWWGLCWPKEYGGQERSAIELFLFIEEMTLASCPYLSLTYTSMGPTILRVGTEEQKKLWLPRITSGEIEFAAGYSEPEAGTDLASLRTRADLDGDHYVVNGQKTWNTGGHSATHQWLAVRTDQEARKHQGVSLLIVPMDAPGITIRPLINMAGQAGFNEVFFDNVRIPKANLVGEL
ncbi:MAG: acyl-CoA dehydrogenase family protein, partial [Candidatus Binatia bacterium]